MAPRNNGDTTGREGSGRFAPGNPGRPQGARHKATMAALALLDGEAVALTRQAVTMALAGDGAAMGGGKAISWRMGFRTDRTRSLGINRRCARGSR